MCSSDAAGLSFQYSLPVNVPEPGAKASKAMKQAPLKLGNEDNQPK
jgi:hypothetical protein